jgi:hypothetical protein
MSKTRCYGRKVIPIFVVQAALLSAGLCLSQEQPVRLILKFDQTTSGPYFGQRESLCLRVYANGRVIYSDWSRSAMSVVDKTGKETSPEKTVSREYSAPENDLWQIDELDEFLKSKAVLRLAGAFGPPHRPVDFFETSDVEIPRSNLQPKRISVREYYVASLVEKTKYPPALLILMDRIARIKDEAADKGKPAEPPADCKLQHQ